MELFRLFGSILVKDEASKQIDNVEKKSDSASGKISNSFKKIGGAIVTAFAVDKIIGFGKTLVETSAKMQALDSQFTQTFKGDQAKAMELINKQAKDQNINVDRLKGTWSSFYGTFRGNGADANKSLELTNKYMKLAADGAAYYDLSLEDVSGRLKSLVMGNFEAGDAIGVNINATKMDIAAKEKYKKAWKDLSDTEKEYLLIDTVGKIYKNNGAMGQGSREANNWSNVMENLKTSWERFLSIVGSPVLAGATKVVQGLTGIVEQLTAKVRSFDVGKFVSQLSDVGALSWATKNTLSILKDVFITVKDRFIEIVNAIVEKAQEWYTNNQDTITKLVVSFNMCMTMVKQIINDAVDIIMALWDNFGRYILDGIAVYLQLIMDRVKNVLGIIQGIFKTITSLIKGDWNGAWDGVKMVLSNALEFIVRLLIEQLLGNFINKIGEWGSVLLGKIKGIFSNVTGSFSGLITSISSKASSIKDILVKPFQGAFDGIKGWIAKIKDAVSNMFNTYIKRPKFSFSGSLNPMNWDTQGLPKLGIDWYADGGILTKPTIFGINGNKAMVGGEAGPEAVLPIEKLSGILADTLKSMNFGGDIYIQLDGKTIAKAMNPYADKIQGKNIRLAERGLV